jgi:ribose transport system ATP-binding protein
VPKLEVKDIVMQFPAVRALNGVSMAFEQGEVHGIVGENGAGKSTLMNILSGVLRPTSGSILLEDKPIILHGVRDAMRHGIAMMHQELNLVDELTVAENVFLGREVTKGGLLDRAKMIEETDGYLQQVHTGFTATEKVGNLSIAGKQLVEIAKAISVKAEILIMDEPTAVLSDPEAEALFEIIAKLRERGTTVLYISHRLAEVCAICDRITVLRDGVKVVTMDAKGSTPAQIADLMVGRALSDFYPPKLPEPSEPAALRVENFAGSSFEVRPGEILGLAGLVGAGRTELAEAIIGIRPIGLAQLKVKGELVKIGNPRQAMRYGIAYVSEDRKGLGLHTDLSCIHNITMANLRSYGQFINQSREKAAAADWKQGLDIRAGDLAEPVSSLSGGNQQKISLAKWLDTKPTILILDEPTRGVDVGAKREIYDLIQRLASEGLACIVISSELPEIIGLCHRTVVMREGVIVGEVGADNLNEEAVMRLAAGVAA